MGIGLGIVLLVVGLIFVLNVVHLPESVNSHLDSHALGWILIIAGALAIVLALVMNAQRSRVHSTRVERHIEE